MSPVLNRPLTGFRVAAWGLGLWPAAELGWRILHAQLGANPVEFIEHFTGLWALRLLLVTLAMTPLRSLTGRVEFIQIRRLLGLWAYVWACVHFSAYLTFDLEWSPGQLAEDLIERTYITIGFAAWLLLLPLAITSTQGWQRRLKRRWKSLHRLIYPAALLAGVHYFWLVKSDVREPLVYLAITAGLLALRAPWKRLRHRLTATAGHPS
ncbi:MAG: sulfite oxidase heme-binding subunit YedZ [Panacagrimonas sp.]